jgi:nucleotide-binding universal stress UspA family protein
MYENILVAYDGLKFSQAALNQGAGLARLCKSKLHLLGIVATTGSSGLAEAYGEIDVWGMEREELEQALNVAALESGKQGVNVITCIRQGDPGLEIITYAHEINADLVVLGHSEKGIIERWFDGSVGGELLRHLPCSLLIAKA